MTTINFERSGGTTGKDFHLDLDFNTLPEDESHRLLKLIEDADFFNISKKPVNMKVAMDVRGDDFVEFFLQQMESLSRSIQD